MCQQNAYLVPVAVDTLAVAANFRNYHQEGVLHRLLAGVGIPVADSRGYPIGYLGMRRQCSVGAG